MPSGPIAAYIGDRLVDGVRRVLVHRHSLTVLLRTKLVAVHRGRVVDVPIATTIVVYVRLQGIVGVRPGPGLTDLEYPISSHRFRRQAHHRYQSIAQSHPGQRLVASVGHYHLVADYITSFVYLPRSTLTVYIGHRLVYGVRRVLVDRHSLTVTQRL